MKLDWDCHLDVLTPALSGATVTITPPVLVAVSEISWNSACSSLTSQSLCSFLPRKYPLLKYKLSTFCYQNFGKVFSNCQIEERKPSQFCNLNRKIIEVTLKKLSFSSEHTKKTAIWIWTKRISLPISAWIINNQEREVPVFVVVAAVSGDCCWDNLNRKLMLIF